MVTLVADKEVRRGDFIKSQGESLNGGDLNGQVGLHRNAGTNNAMRNIKTRKSFGSLLDEFLSVNEKDRAFTALKSLFNHPTGHDSFACTARSDADNALVIQQELVSDVVDKLLLVGTKYNIGIGHDRLSFLKFGS